MTGAQTHSYDYDLVGNREIADGVTYTPNNLNQYTQAGATNYGYENNGNLTNDGTNTYTYDEENRLTTVNNSLHTAQYAYDAFNRRVSKTVDGITTYFIQDGDREIEERDSSGVLLADYTFGDSIDEVLTMNRGVNTYYHYYDGLGSVTELTDASGTLVENYTYDPYGLSSITLSTVGNPFQFTGRRLDDESGLYFYRARQNDPTIGRFLQRDPIGYTVDSLNLYEYAMNNSVRYTDPFGLYQYETTNVGIAFIHESNPFNTDGSFYQQASSIGSFFGGDLADAVATSGQSIVEQTNAACKDSGWQNAYTGAQITAGVAALTAGALIGVEAATAIRIEVHGTHGGRVLPHLQGIKGPGWGQTLWRFPPH